MISLICECEKNYTDELIWATETQPQTQRRDMWSPRGMERGRDGLGALGISGGSHGKESACNVGDLGQIPSLRRSPARGHGNPLQYSCLGNPHRQKAWQATARGVTKSQTGLSDSAQHRCKLVHIGWIKKVLLYSTGNYIQQSVINHNEKGY